MIETSHHHERAMTEKGENDVDCKGKRRNNDRHHFMGTHSETTQKSDFIEDIDFSVNG